MDAVLPESTLCCADVTWQHVLPLSLGRHSTLLWGDGPQQPHPGYPVRDHVGIGTAAGVSRARRSVCPRTGRVRWPAWAAGWWRCWSTGCLPTAWPPSAMTLGLIPLRSAVDGGPGDLAGARSRGRPVVRVHPGPVGAGPAGGIRRRAAARRAGPGRGARGADRVRHTGVVRRRRRARDPGPA